MADYKNLQGAIDSGITNMTVLRDNSANDNGTDTITANLSWFKFNSVVVSKVYASGNSWLGFGALKEQLKVNRRNCIMYSLYSESGTIENTKFFKIRWMGRSTSADGFQDNVDCYQFYDVFLFDTGAIFLNYYNVPKLINEGVNSLVCGSESLTFKTKSGVACEWTFTPSDKENGTGWSVAEGRPAFKSKHYYKNLQEALDAGITNMTVLRDNSANDDDTDTIAAGLTWFKFNGVEVANIYASGNSWLGFGVSSEHLNVNHRDCKMYYLYSESGNIGVNKFFKIRWMGTSAYSSSYQNSAEYQQYYDVFLFDNGSIYLSYYNVPTSSFDGSNNLVCGSETVTFTPTSGKASEWTFTPADIENGTGWSVAEGRPLLIVEHKTSGSAVYEIAEITGTINKSAITWTEDVPSGTTLKVSVSTDNSNFKMVSNGDEILPIGEVLSGTRLYVKGEMSTSDKTVTPSLKDMNVIVQTVEDTYSIVLETEPLERFESYAIGGCVSVPYELGDVVENDGVTVSNGAVSLAPASGESKADIAPYLNTIDGMECLRNNLGQDDGTDTVIGVDWFKFNGTVADKIYVNGNSYVGFGSDAQHLRIFNRDGKMLYLYRQEGSIGAIPFLKIRWEGYSYYNQTSDSYSLKWELFLFGNGQMFLNVINVPTSGDIGVTSLTCGSNSYTFTLTARTPVSYTFTPSDSTGSAWIVSDSNRLDLEELKPNGSVIFELPNIIVQSAKSVKLSWAAELPDETSANVYISSDKVTWDQVNNGESIPSDVINSDGSVFVKIELSTEVTYITPVILDVLLTVEAEGIAISYEQPKGNLMGAGGLVADFKMSFLPTDLIAKPHQNDAEHIEISDITAVGNLIRIYYTDAAETEHIEISSIEAVGVLTHINDL